MNKETKESWPALTSWPPAPPPPQQQFSWPSAGIPESYLTEALQASWPSSAPPAPVQSAPPAAKTITHTYLTPQYLTDDSSLKKGIEKYLTTYTVKDGPGLSSYNALQGSTGYRGGSYAPAYGRAPPLEARRPVLPPPSKPAIKKPIYGQPIPIEDSYEHNKGTAPVYNENGARVNAENNNRVQFQNSVSGDYNGGGSAQTYSDNSNVAAAGNDYKSPNEINYEDGRLKSVSGDYNGSPVDNEASGYDETNDNNELANENAAKEQTYVSNSVPAVRIPGYKKKAKV